MQQSLYAINFVVKLITFSFRNNMNPGAGDQFFPYEYPQYPPGWIYPLPGPYMFNDRGNPSPFPSTTSTDSLPESLQFSEDSSMPASTPSSSRRASSSAENKKARDRWRTHGVKKRRSFQFNCGLKSMISQKAENHKALTAWCCVLFPDFVLKCNCSFLDNFFCYWPISSRICPEQI